MGHPSTTHRHLSLVVVVVVVTFSLRNLHGYFLQISPLWQFDFAALHEKGVLPFRVCTLQPMAMAMPYLTHDHAHKPESPTSTLSLAPLHCRQNGPSASAQITSQLPTMFHCLAAAL